MLSDLKENMQHAIVLAAGRGERLWPLTRYVPKPLLPLPGRESILARLVKQLLRVSPRVAVVVREGLRSRVLDHLRLYNVEVERVDIVEQPRGGYGTGYAVKVALEKLGLDSGYVMIVNGDLVLEDNVVEIVARCKGSCLAVFDAEDGRRYGIVVIENGKVSRIVEKPGWSGVYPVNAGVYKFNVKQLADALSSLKPSPRGEYEITDAINHLARRESIQAVKINASDRLEVTHWWDYLDVASKLLDRVECKVLKPTGTIVVRGKVCVTDDADVKPLTVLEGPAWIEGEVGPHAHVRPYTFIARGARVGAFTQVKASIVLENAKIPHLNYVGDSVVGPHSNLGAGSITANLRFDHATVKSGSKLPGSARIDTGRRKLGAVIGPYAQVGVNASLMPGARIGACSWVEPGAVVKGDVPDCSFYKRGGVITKLESTCCRGLLDY